MHWITIGAPAGSGGGDWGIQMHERWSQWAPRRSQQSSPKHEAMRESIQGASVPGHAWAERPLWHQQHTEERGTGTPQHLGGEEGRTEQEQSTLKNDNGVEGGERGISGAVPGGGEKGEQEAWQ
eukprot:GGOE01059887.1.p2 GENE.GGOE01059887.1~~GGOE01059887.1.p2  ORF type:complete len:124 (+),score=3.71 GGOE01059887.1:193-564(+)